MIFVSSTSPLEIVFATSTDRNAPTRLSTPAMNTAVRGFSAPVAIEVATALAVSWKPLVKSNASAVTMTTTITIREISISPSSGRGNGRTVRTPGKQQMNNRPPPGRRAGGAAATGIGRRRAWLPCHRARRLPGATRPTRPPASPTCATWWPTPSTTPLARCCVPTCELAEQVITDDARIDELRTAAEEQVFTLLVLQAPVATDLRIVVSGLHAAGDIERMGDLAVHIAQAARRRHPTW